MNRPVREGDVIAEQYLLDSRISDSGNYQRWLATRQQFGDRVCLTILDATDDIHNAIEHRVSLTRGLVHENILAPILATAIDEQFIIVEPYFRGGLPLGQSSAAKDWAAIRQLLTAVSYCHDLGIVHGNLCPANILMNEAGELRICGFALASGHTPEQAAFLSPQLQAGAEPDLTDDLFAVGQLLFLMLTGKTWEPGVELNTPLPDVPAGMLLQLLSDNSIDRRISLQDLLEALAQHFEPRAIGIQSASFSRAGVEPGAPAAPIATSGNEGIPMSLAIGGLVALIFVGILLFLLIPENGVRSPATAPPTASTTSPAAVPASEPAGDPATAETPSLTPLEAARQEHLKAEGERIGREILKRQIELEDNGANLWAAETYNELTSRLDEADVIYRENQFEAAFEAYEAVLAELDTLIKRIPQVLAEQTAAGRAALAAGDAEAAMTAFTIATQLAPDDAALEKQLRRAENLEEVLTLTNRAEIQERNGELESSNQLFTEASELDPDWQPAAAGRERTAAAIQQQRFRAAMSRGFQGIAARDYEAARRGFVDAQAILPGSAEPADGLLQIEQAERNDSIETLRREAAAAEAAFDWQAALTAFESALAISPSLEFAQSGKQRAEQRLTLREDVQRLLRDPTLLQDDSVYADAGALIREAMRTGDMATEFQQQINTLAQLVSAARVEIPVTIESNGDTDVTVRRFRQLGKISSETVYLIPGKYTIVGERAGYRDVREELILLPGRPAPIVVIASEERVR